MAVDPTSSEEPKIAPVHHRTSEDTMREAQRYEDSAPYPRDPLQEAIFFALQALYIQQRELDQQRLLERRTQWLR